MGLVLLCINRKSRKEGILFILLVLPITLLYMSYYFARDKYPFMIMRFILPTFYIYAIAGFWGLKLVRDAWKKTATALIVILLVVNTLWGVPQLLLYNIILKNANASLAAVERVVRENVKPGTVVIAHSQIQHFLDYIGRWRLLDDNVIDGTDMKWLLYYVDQGSVGKNLIAISQFVERHRKRLSYMTSRLSRMSDRTLNELMRWSDQDKEIYWIGRINLIKNKVPSNDNLTLIEKIETPKLENVLRKIKIPYLSKQVSEMLYFHVKTSGIRKKITPDPF